VGVFLGLWTLKAFFLEGFEVWTPVLKMCVWFKTLAARSVSGRSNKQMGGGFVQKLRKLSVSSLVFTYGLGFCIPFFNLSVPKLWRLWNDDNLPNSNWFLQT
jgi:hypothetical protein